MRRERPALLTFAQMDEIEKVYVRRKPGTEEPDPRLVDVFTEHYRLRMVLARAEKLIRTVRAGEEACVCTATVEDGKLVHFPRCPLKLLEQDVRRAGGLQ